MSDFKSQLNLFCQSKWSQPAKYVDKNVGLQHQPTWQSVVTLPDQRSFRVERFAGLVAAAQQEVARVALESLETTGELTVKRAVVKQTTTLSSSSSSSSSSPTASPAAVRVVAVSSTVQQPIVHSMSKPKVQIQQTIILFLAKALDVFRSSLVRPCNWNWFNCLEFGWIAMLKKMTIDI